MINSRIQILHAAAMVVAGLIVGSGCSSTLETGYQPRKLGASDETRRGFYAQPFTPEAQAAKQYQQDFGDSKQPKPAY